MPDDVINFETAIEEVSYLCCRVFCSFTDAVMEALETKYTAISVGEYLIPHCVKADLTPSLGMNGLGRTLFNIRSLLIDCSEVNRHN
jgi:hypothetical protein